MKEQRTSLRKRVTRGLAGIACAGVFLATSFLGCAISGKQGSFFGDYEQLKSSKEIIIIFSIWWISYIS